ncbi:MAG: cation diffusion facilitator family transporter [Verrucomicrobium sp.]|nr:cation diffusion facilitator family transporter [Verrucomicrobium sp.]
MEPAHPKKHGVHRALFLTTLGLLVNAALAAVKITAGVLGHSTALFADGIESSADTLTSLIIWAGFRQSLRPPDASHPFGHGKVESLAGFLVALALLGASLVIAVQGVGQVLHPGPEPHWLTLPVLAIVIVIKEFLARRVLSTGEDLQSRSLHNEAWHHRADALTSIAAFVGISVALLGGPKYVAADGVAALVACVIVAINGLRLLGPSLDDMLDAAPPAALRRKIRELAESVKGVERIEKCRVRKSGLELQVVIHVEVDGQMTVEKGHAIAHDVKDRLIESSLGVAEVDVHIEPAGQTEGREHTPPPSN